MKKQGKVTRYDEVNYIYIYNVHGLTTGTDVGGVEE